MQQVAHRNPRQIMICGIASWGMMHTVQKANFGPEAPVQQDPHLVADGVASSVANNILVLWVWYLYRVSRPANDFPKCFLK
jgi:hypothetical protein